MTLSSRAIEAARISFEAWVKDYFTDWSRSLTDGQYQKPLVERAWQAFLAGIAHRDAALAAEGMVLAPKEPTAKMIAAAFPTTDRDVSSRDDLKIGAEAIMILEGGRDCGSITGPAVREAASMCKDYRAMLSAHQADEDGEGK